MVNASQIKEHMQVVGSDGQHVGTIDHVEGDRIKLTRNDPTAQGQHHYIPLNAVASVEQNAVRLNQTAQEAQQQWQGDAARSQTTGGSKGQGGSMGQGGGTTGHRETR